MNRSVPVAVLAVLALVLGSAGSTVCVGGSTLSERLLMALSGRPNGAAGSTTEAAGSCWLHLPADDRSCAVGPGPGPEALACSADC